MKAHSEGLIRMIWKRPKGYPRGFYLILKLGDYCSGWLPENGGKRLSHLTQEQWDSFQAKNNIAWPRYGARSALA